MIKLRIVLFFLLFSLFSQVSAETITYSPDWKTGDTFQYKTRFSIDYSPSESNSRTFHGELTLGLQYTVIETTSEYTHFALKITSLDGFTQENDKIFTFKDSFLSPAENTEKHYQEFQKILTSKNFLHYKINPEGKVIETTHLPELIEWWHKLEETRSPFLRKYPSKHLEQENFLHSTLFHLFLNYNPYFDTSFSFHFGPHNSRYLQKQYTLNTVTEDPLILQHGGIGVFTPHPFTLQLDGTTSLTQTDQGTIFSSTHPFTKKEILTWRKTILDHLLLSSSTRSWLEQNLLWLQNSQIEINGAFKSQMTLLPSEKIANTSHWQGEFTYKNLNRPAVKAETFIIKIESSKTPSNSK